MGCQKIREFLKLVLSLERPLHSIYRFSVQMCSQTVVPLDFPPPPPNCCAELALKSRRKLLNPDTEKLRGQAFGSSSVCSLPRNFRLSLGDLIDPSCSSVCCVFFSCVGIQVFEQLGSELSVRQNLEPVIPPSSCSPCYLY